VLKYYIGAKKKDGLLGKGNGWLRCKRSGLGPYGKIYREEGPPEEIGYVWDFVGKERESELFGVYETKDPNSKSYGGIMFSHTASHQYDGFYFRLENGEIAKVSISLKRV
jgi:hypothetical protein